MHKFFGFTFTEVLISFLILSFVLIGIDILQIKTFKDVKANYYFTIANQQLHSFIERLSSLKGRNEEISVQMWESQNKELLPNARMSVSGTYPVYDITLAWGNPIQHCDKIKIGGSGCIKLIVNMS